MRLLLFLLSTFLFSGFSFSQYAPLNGVKDSKSEIIALKNATVYINSTNKITNATVLVADGKIVEVGTKITIPSGALEIDMNGKTIVPAFVELYSNVGIPSQGERNYSQRPQIESSKKGSYYWNEAIRPEVEAAALFDVDAKAVENFSKMGFGFAVTHVQDGIVRGTGALVGLGNSNTRKQLISSNAAQFYSFAKGSSGQTYPSSQMGSIALLRQALYDLRYYSENKNAEQSLSLEKWKSNQNLPVFFKTEDKWEILRAAKIANEFKQNFYFVGSGNEYLITKQLKEAKSTVVLPLNFPEAYDVKDPYLARQIPLSDLKNWELAPSNPYLLSSEGIQICLTSLGTKSPEQFWKNLQKAISRGLKIEDALAALTSIPAKLIGAENLIGGLEKGKLASFSVYTSDPFLTEATLLEAWNQGTQQIIKSLPSVSILGKYSLNIEGKNYQAEFTESNEKPVGKIQLLKSNANTPGKKDTVSVKMAVTLIQNDISLQFNCDDDNFKGSINLHAKISNNGSVFEGDGTLPNGKWVRWSGIKTSKSDEKKEPSSFKLDSTFIAKTWFPNLAYGFDSIPEVRTVVFKNATVWTNEKEGIIKDATVITENGKIKSISTNSNAAPTKAVVIDAKGKHLTAGIIDEHSHIAISKGVNEGGQAISAEVNISDVVTADDINVYRQLAGGVTAAQLLHGSANPIGGQSALIKLKWGHTPDEMLIPNAPKFIKCALGENVKQANWGDFNTVRFPQTRMGVEQVFYDGFARARAYKEELDAYAKNPKKAEGAPRKDLELDVLVEILESKRFITCHSYVQSEINMLMHVADSMDFKINTFTHILEGYKVADKMKAHGVGGSTFADWWAYKFEVNDAIPYNAKMMADQGVVVAINSDDAEMGRRLNQEAAKSVKYGGMSEEEAWKMVTLNPAKLLHLDDRMGSVKVGKDADIVLWSDNPLSIKAKVELTMIDGKVLYSSADASKLEERNTLERARIINKMLESNDKGEPVKPFVKKGRKHYHCDTLGEEGTEEENLH
jgi:imidazolonepropionase-like amidohydrolase